MRAVCLLLCTAACTSPVQPIPAGPDEAEAPGCDGGRLYGSPPPPYLLTLGGQTYVVRNGQVWKDTGNGTGQLVRALYDPKFAEQFSVEGCQIFRLNEDKTGNFPVGKSFTAEFDDPVDLQGLINPDAGFTGFVLQSPAAPTVTDYVALRACLLRRTCGFRDNTLEVRAGSSPDGGVGLRATSLKPTPSMGTAKASIESELVHFVRGDVVTIGLWVRAVDGVPYGLVDLESSLLDSAPGPRLLIEQGQLEVELKWADKPRFKQAKPATAFPVGPWVRVEVQYRLQPDQTGHVKVWQDGVLVIDADGQTLPLPNTILNSLELGITANNDGTAVLDLDGVNVR